MARPLYFDRPNTVQRWREHDWQRGPVHMGNPTMVCSLCGKVWWPDQTAKQKGRCRGKR